MKKIYYFLLAILVLTGCNKEGGGNPKNKNGLFQVNIEGNTSIKFHVEGGCDKAHAMYIPGNYNNILIINGFDGKQIIGITIYFKGSYPTNPIFKLGIDDGGSNGVLSGWGNFIPDFNNGSTFYSTDDRHFGSCTITNYDQTNQRISGTFSFDGQFYNNGAMGAGVVNSFTGNFSNVPINDLSDPDHPKGPCFGSNGIPLGGGNSGTGNTGGTSLSTITFKNATFTDADVTINGQTKQAPKGGSTIFSGEPGTKVSGSAITSGKTSGGVLVGLNVTWNINTTFPSTKGVNLNYPLNVAADMLFLKMQNRSGISISKVYVNYGLTSQTLDNITIPSDNVVYSLGYYKAYTNSNVRAENGSTHWIWNTLSLPFINNQTITVTATP